MAGHSINNYLHPFFPQENYLNYFTKISYTEIITQANLAWLDHSINNHLHPFFPQKRKNRKRKEGRLSSSTVVLRDNAIIHCKRSPHPWIKAASFATVKIST